VGYLGLFYTIVCLQRRAAGLERAGETWLNSAHTGRNQRKNNMPRPIKATIDLAALKHNLAVARRHAPRAAVFAVVKANAYGHGVERIAPALSSVEGCALLELDIALRLREAKARQRILLLEGAFSVHDFKIAAAHELSIVVHHEEQIRMLDSVNTAPRLDVVLKLNTGMNRLGFTADHAKSAVERLQNHPAVAKLTLMTHFADADDQRGVAWQMAAFERMTTGFKLERTLANSAALLRYPETHGDWIRPGIMLYGCSPFADVSAAELGLKPVMTLTSELIAVRDLQHGDRIGYGGAFDAPHSMRVGIVACGYADGYPRHAPTGTPLLVNGKRTRTLGRVSMDLLYADLTAVPEANVGSAVTLWGAGLSADEVAASAGTVSYELLCALAPRVPVSEIPAQ
jgi:alanine racemase